VAGVSPAGLAGQRHGPQAAPPVATMSAAPAAGALVLHRRHRVQDHALYRVISLRVRSWFATVGLGLALAGGIVHAAPIRVVSQTVGSDELLLALAQPSEIAALSHLARDPQYSAVSAEAAKYPQLALGDAETVLRFHPTLVLLANYSRAELVEQLRRSGVHVIVFDRYESIDDAFANLRLLAKQLDPDAPPKAERIIGDCRERMRVLRARLRGVKPVRVIAPSTYGVIPGSDTTVQDICDHAGAINLAATLGHLHGNQAPPNERMLTWPIDALILSGDNADTALTPFRRLPPYQYMRAVKEARVALLAPYMLSTVSHYRVAAYEQLARALHPEAFR